MEPRNNTSIFLLSSLHTAKQNVFATARSKCTSSLFLQARPRYWININSNDMIAGYIRVSTAKQHPENQMDEIKRYAESNRMDVNKWVVEVISGKAVVKGRKLGRLLKGMNKSCLKPIPFSLVWSNTQE